MANQQPNRQYLVISALGRDHPGLVNALTAPVTETGCNIVDSRMTVLGAEFAVLMLVEGAWSALARLEAQLPGLRERLGLIITSKRTELQQEGVGGLPYEVNVVALDHPGIVNGLAGFFSARSINIQDLYTDSYRAPHTGTQMFSANMTVNIPPDVHIARLREEFLDFCNSLNLDAVLGPVKS